MTVEREDSKQHDHRPMNGWEAINSIVGNIMTGAVICFIVWVIYLIER
jgi:hypothetical protein